MATSDLLRVFVALPLSDALHAGLARVQQDLRRACPEGSVRWVRPEGIHLTLFFIGEVLPERIDPIREALAVVARHAAPFAAAVRGVGVFPNPQRARVIWVGLEEPTGRLALLHLAVNEALAQVGFEPEERDFSPHLTLGRVGRNVGREEPRRIGEAVVRVAAQGCDLGAESLATLVLFRSVLKPEGAVYTPLATFALGESRCFKG